MNLFRSKKGKSTNDKLNQRALLVTVLALACFALSLTVQAAGLKPPPDGGYSGNNTAEGDNAHFSS